MTFPSGRPRRPSSDIVELQMAKHVFTGGLRMSWFNATWPFARMTLDDDGIVVRVLGFAAFQTAWPALTRAERVIGGVLGSAGVRLTRMDGRRVVFWTFRPEPILDALRTHGFSPTESQRPPKIWFGTGP
jgi:hypothetical protein